MNPVKRILIPVAFTCLLLTARVMITGELTYIFLAWNLFLAWIPFAVSGQLAKKTSGWKIWFLVGAWLLFLPNAPYIITDFFHLKHRAPVPYWFDVLLLFSTAMNGLLLGLASVLRVEKFIAGKYGNIVSGILISCSLYLSAFGIYIGRWLRWNSWDVLFNPGELASDIAVRILNPFDHILTWSVTALFGSFLYLLYYSFRELIIISNNQS